MKYTHDDKKADLIRKQTRSSFGGIPDQVYNTASPCMFCLESHKVKNPDSTCFSLSSCFCVSKKTHSSFFFLLLTLMQRVNDLLNKKELVVLCEWE